MLPSYTWFIYLCTWGHMQSVKGSKGGLWTEKFKFKFNQNIEASRKFNLNSVLSFNISLLFHYSLVPSVGGVSPKHYPYATPSQLPEL